MKFTVDCKTWRFGGDDDETKASNCTALLNEKGMMCCLGHCAKNMGLLDHEIKSNGSPERVWKVGSTIQSYLDLFTDGVANNSLSRSAMILNDHDGLTHVQRMLELKQLFVKHGHEIEFDNVEALGEEVD